MWLWVCQNWSRRLDDPSVYSLLRSTSGNNRQRRDTCSIVRGLVMCCFDAVSASIPLQVLEAQRRHQKEKSGIIPTSPTPYTYNKVSPMCVQPSLTLQWKFLEIIISSPYTELWLVVSWCDYLRNALRLSSVLLQTPQSNNPKGHEEEDYDGQLRFPRRWVEPDFWDGQGHCTQVCRYLFWLPSCFHLNSWIRHSKLYIYIYLWLQCHKIQRM